MIEAVLFDLDGTFADTAPDLGEALNHVLSQRGLPALPLTAIRPVASQGSPGLLKLGLGIEPGGPGYDVAREAFLQHYEAHICDRTRLFPGMSALLAELDQRDVPWGIVTNKPHRFTVPLMEKLGYAKRATCLVSGDTCQFSKPHPMPLLHAASLMGIAPENCLYLGDDLRDMEAAHAAGMLGIVAAYGYIDPATGFGAWPSDGSVNTPFGLLKYFGEN